ncbi:MAG: hypothetical protein OEL76_06675 [Siculibacillus sp.]|nr:hypothetical protein [Siculibacillus sp.]
MPRPRTLFAVASLAAAFLHPGVAAATATLTCDVEEKSFAFHLQAAVGHEAMTLSGLRGELRLDREGIALDLDSEALMQAWIEGGDLRLRFHIYGEADRPDVDFVVLTRRRGETAHPGRYRLIIGGGETRRTRRGAIGCVLG